MYTIDLRKLGKITKECEDYLSKLLADACIMDGLKHEFSLLARKDFGWCNENLLPYVVAGYITSKSSRVQLDNYEFISSSEWLNSIFVSGKTLNIDHLLITMSYINKNISFMNFINESEYKSGKNTWIDAPMPLKNILDVLDDACLFKQSVEVYIPTISSSDHIIQNKLDTNTLNYDEIKDVKQTLNIQWS
jgi:hypothetical protein